jgi:hypothetical protein
MRPGDAPTTCAELAGEAPTADEVRGWLARADEDAANASALAASAASLPWKRAASIIMAATALRERSHLYRAIARSLDDAAARSREARMCIDVANDPELDRLVARELLR